MGVEVRLKNIFILESFHLKKILIIFTHVININLIKKERVIYGSKTNDQRTDP